LFLRDAGPTEIGGFGLAAAGDLLLVAELALVRQTCTATYVEFDDASVADLFDELVDAGRQPEEFGRIWIHTHPGSSAEPSRTDEQTFARAFGGTDWAVMFILARGGQAYARLRYHVGPGADVLLPVEVDYSRPFAASDEAFWQSEYDRCVRPELPPLPPAADVRLLPPLDNFVADDWYDAWDEYVDPRHAAHLPVAPLEATDGYRDEF
jgi:proteasome lid subunit RPN8/RPN11